MPGMGIALPKRPAGPKMMLDVVVRGRFDESTNSVRPPFQQPQILKDSGRERAFPGDGFSEPAASGARDACWSCLLRVKAEALQPKARLLSQMLLSHCPGSDKKVGLHLQRRIRRLRSREEEDLGHPDHARPGRYVRVW